MYRLTSFWTCWLRTVSVIISQFTYLEILSMCYSSHLGVVGQSKPKIMKLFIHLPAFCWAFFINVHNTIHTVFAFKPIQCMHSLEELWLNRHMCKFFPHSVNTIKKSDEYLYNGIGHAILPALSLYHTLTECRINYPPNSLGGGVELLDKVQDTQFNSNFR